MATKKNHLQQDPDPKAKQKPIERQKLLRSVLETLDNNASINLQTTFWFNELMKLHGINYSNYRMLRFLYKRPEGAEPSVVADYLVTLRQTITNMTDELENMGLVVRQSHPTDRRRILLFLTDRGHELTCNLIKEMDSIEERVFDCFTTEEMEQYIRIRHRIVSQTEEEIKKIYQSKQ